MANEREKAAKGVDSVTDYVDVREDASLAGSVAAALSSSSSSSSANSAAAVVIKASDVALLQEELDLTRDAAEGLLRQARGDFAAALSAYIQGGM